MITESQLNQGNFLFRYRGILPIPIILLCIIFYYLNSNSISNDHYIICLGISVSGLFIRMFTPMERLMRCEKLY